MFAKSSNGKPTWCPSARAIASPRPRGDGHLGDAAGHSADTTPGARLPACAHLSARLVLHGQRCHHPPPPNTSEPMSDIYRKNDRPGDILQQDWRRYLETDFGHEPWLTVYCHDEGPFGTTVFFCALVPNTLVVRVLESESWELTLGAGRPACSSKRHPDGSQSATYHRFGEPTGVEPLILCREFHGVKDDYIEVSEEFRLFHNLYHNQTRNVYTRIDSAGNDEDVILVEPDRVQIRLRQIRQFLAIKDMHLACYFSIDRESDKTIHELAIGERISRGSANQLIWRFGVMDRQFYSGVLPTMTRLEGKKIVSPIEKEKCGIWPFEVDDVETYEDFIIATDNNERPVLHTCDPEQLANYFGKNPDAPHYLTPVFFRREVLGKYYNRPELYSVDDGYLKCASLWGISIDNDHPNHVVVYLGDLGRDLPATERGHWKSFNVAPEGDISATAFQRDFLAAAAEPETPELVFKQHYRVLRREWADKFGWPLFSSDTEDADRTLDALHTPLTEDRLEFEQQTVALAVVLIDSLNEAELSKRAPRSKKDAGKIDILERFLRKGRASDYDEHIAFLSEIHAARQRKSAQPPEGGRRTSFILFLQRAIALLSYLERLTALVPADGFEPADPPTPRGGRRQVSPKPDGSVDLAIITIIPEEHQAITALIPDLKFESGLEDDPNLYYWETGHITSPNHSEPYRTVVAFAGSAGTVNGEIVTTATIERWNPRYVLMVGVAGGLPLHGLSKGDVVISTHIFGYEYGKIHKGFDPRINHVSGVDGGLLNCAIGFAGRHSNWTRGIGATCPNGPYLPKVLSGPVASGDKVVDDIGDSFFRAVRETWPKLQAVEMEGAGACAAIKNAQDKGRRVGFLMIRGISDMPPELNAASESEEESQTSERDSWKVYASTSAATFAIEFVRSAWPVKPRAQR